MATTRANHDANQLVAGRVAAQRWRWAARCSGAVLALAVPVARTGTCAHSDYHMRKVGSTRSASFAMLTTEPERPSSRLSHTLEDHVIRTPIKSLGVCMRTTNAANAVALIVTGLVSILSGAALGNGGRRLLSTMLLSIYAAGFGALLLRCELQPASDHLRATYGFLVRSTPLHPPRRTHSPERTKPARVAVHMDGPTRIHPPRGQPRLDPRPARRLRRRVHQRQRRLPRLRAREAPSLRRGARVWPFAHIQRRAGGRQRVGSARPCERRRRVASVARPVQITTTSSAFSLWRHRSRRTDGRARRRPVSLAMAFASTATDNPQTAEHPRDA